MRAVAAMLVVAGGLATACDDAPGNEYTAACLNVMREKSSSIFGDRASVFAEPFCSCIGKTIAGSKKLDAADKARVLGYFKAFDPDEGLPRILIEHAEFRQQMGEKYDTFKAAADKCQNRLAR